MGCLIVIDELGCFIVVGECLIVVGGLGGGCLMVDSCWGSWKVDIG